MKLAVVAGEASGDLHAAEVVRELKQLEPTLQTFGIGGDLLRKQGTKILYHAREMGIVGLFNVLRHLGMFRRIFRELLERIRVEKPDAVLLVDYPDFNLRVARKCKAMGLRVVYYISPQVWAWRRGRVKQIAKSVDHMIVIFPFEEDFYRQQNVPVTYVGHPLIEQLAMIRRKTNKSEVTRIALLPGSRRMEVNALLPAMLDAVAILQREGPVQAFIVQAPTIDHDELEDILRSRQVEIPILAHDRGEALAAADVAMSSSGTATLECAIVGTPVVVMYRLSPMTYRLAKWLVKLPHFSLVNIIAGKQIVPELLQHEVTGPNIARAVRDLLVPSTYERTCFELQLVKARLGDYGASRRAAEAIMSVARG
ncbi:MAG TPA: lipid-A-disaccharide synthase [Thermoanaerobaculia bacterium]